MNDIILNDRDYLVELIPDYFAKKKTEGFSTEIRENDDFFVGVIRGVGKDIATAPAMKNILGKIIYFRKNVADVIKLKGHGVYHLVNHDHHKLLIRLDQDENNY